MAWHRLGDKAIVWTNGKYLSLGLNALNTTYPFQHLDTIDDVWKFSHFEVPHFTDFDKKERTPPG